MSDSEQTRPTRIPAVLCLAAGPSQLVVIEKARQLGYAVIAVDRDGQAPGLAHCDEKILASTYEAGPIIRQLRPLLTTYQVEGVINRSAGPPVVTAAALCRELGLPAPAPDAAATISDKSRLLQACRSARIPVPRCQAVSAWDQVDQARITYPCVVKPALSLVGKSGITVVRQAEDLAAACAAALNVSQNGRINLEEFLPGGDVSLTALVEQGTVHPIVLKDELTRVMPDGGIRFGGVAVPSVFSERPEAAAILRLAGQVVAEFRLERTVLNLSCRCEPDGQPRLIEIHLDLGGDVFYESLAPAGTSTDILGRMIGFLAGRPTDFTTPEFQPTALIFAPDAAPGPARSHTIVQAGSRAELTRKIARRLNS